MSRIAVVKLGGSVITDKTVPFSYRGAVVKQLARAMASSGRQVVLVHGGGSFGHPLAKRHGLSSRKTSPSSRGVSETRNAMFELNSKVCASLLSAGLRPYTFSPFTLLDREGEPSFLLRLLAAGLTPVTFGDVVNDGTGFTILSGDTICVELAEMLDADLCVMAIDVDGLLDERGHLVEELTESTVPLLGLGADATGGIGLKVKEALRMVSAGTEVRLVSGRKPTEFAKALKQLRFHGTTVRVAPGVSTR